MTETMLVSLISLICKEATSAPCYGKCEKITLEKRIECYDTLVNCSVGPNGLIMSFGDFNKKCVNKK